MVKCDLSVQLSMAATNNAWSEYTDDELHANSEAFGKRWWCAACLTASCCITFLGTSCDSKLKKCAYVCALIPKMHYGSVEL